MQFICFGSGSSGNCYYLESRGEAILIDLGIGIRAFKKHMRDYGLTIPKIKAIIVTHDIREAVQLADTVHVMSARPGHITDIIPIDLPHPRGRGTRRLERFHALCARVEDALTNTHARTEHEGTPCQSHE